VETVIEAHTGTAIRVLADAPFTEPAKRALARLAVAATVRTA
jgi:hypothetical protein